jgi:hypothetical protein
MHNPKKRYAHIVEPGEDKRSVVELCYFYQLPVFELLPLY